MQSQAHIEELSYDKAMDIIVDGMINDKKMLRAALIQYDMLVKQNSPEIYKDCDLPFWFCQHNKK